MEFEKFHTAKDTYGEMAATCNMILWMESMNNFFKMVGMS